MDICETSKSVVDVLEQKGIVTVFEIPRPFDEEISEIDDKKKLNLPTSRSRRLKRLEKALTTAKQNVFDTRSDGER
ncbi:MAG: hypothetical protein L6V93_11065 [Clostridiales bacterium]|nr:MAG: hypothetical protein L6V93_11065 [Clostridiales bacterium]